MKNKPSVTYLLSAFGHTGGNMVAYKFMDKLSERGYRVAAVTPFERLEWSPNFSSQIIKRLETEKFKGKPPLSRRIKRRFRESQEDSLAKAKNIVGGILKHWQESNITISTYCYTAYANYALMDKTIPLYHMQHYEELFFDEEKDRKLARLTYFMPLGLIANSQWLKEQMKKRFNREAYLLNPAIDSQLFSPQEDIQKKYQKRDKIKIISYCSPRKFKAWDDGVEAMREVFKRLGEDKVEWKVFGFVPPQKPDWPINFVGKVFKEDLVKLYSEAHICFMNSWYESFPLPPIEAMACGTAVVTTRIGTEDYAFDGKNSLVVAPRKPMDLVEAVVKLANDFSLASKLAIEARKTALEFNWDKAADNLEKILEDALKKGRATQFADISSLAKGEL